MSHQHQATGDGIDRIVGAAPPLTDEQRSRISALLRTGATNDASDCRAT